MNHHALLQPGTAIERYTIDGVLGQGGMAVVYRARHRKLGTVHALKLLHVPSRGIRNRLLREGRVQAQLQHRNVVTVTDVVEVDGVPALVMEYVRGPSLERLLRDHRLQLDQVDALVRGIVRGVAAAHAHGLIHRDLKPANVLLAVTEDGLVPKITDFGLAKVLQPEGRRSLEDTRGGVAMGTPPYMAPEQIRSANEVDARADIFALGCIFYEMVTGRRTFHGEDVMEVFTAITRGRYVPPGDIVPELPLRMSRAIRGALEVDRDARLPDCAAMLRVWTDASETAGGPFDMRYLTERYQAQSQELSPGSLEQDSREQPTAHTFAYLEPATDDGSDQQPTVLLRADPLDPPDPSTDEAATVLREATEEERPTASHDSQARVLDAATVQGLHSHGRSLAENAGVFHAAAYGVQVEELSPLDRPSESEIEAALAATTVLQRRDVLLGPRARWLAVTGLGAGYLATGAAALLLLAALLGGLFLSADRGAPPSDPPPHSPIPD